MCPCWSELPCDVIMPLIDEWLGIREVGKLDSACCTKNHRPLMLERISQRFLSVKGSANLLNAHFFPWLVLRKVSVNFLSVHNQQMITILDFIHFSVDIHCLSKLKILDITTSATGYVSYSMISELSKQCKLLEVLVLRNCQTVPLKPFSAFLNFPTLRDLHLHSAKLSSPLILDLISGCGHLEAITIDRCFDFSSKVAHCLDKYNPKLSAISLLDMPTAFRLLSIGFSNLKRLHATEHHHFPIFVQDVESFAASKPNLAEMRIKRCGDLSDGAVMSFADHCHQLTVVDLARCHSTKLTDAGLSYLMKRCGRVQSVDLSKTNLTAATVVTILQHCRQLHSLVATDCARLKGDVDVDMVIAPGCCSLLRTVDLSRCGGLQDSVMCGLATAAPQLICLNLSYCALLSDQAIAHLAEKCLELTELHLKACKLLTNAAVSALSHHCKQLRILNILHCVQIDEVASECQFAHRCDVIGAKWRPYYAKLYEF